MVALMFPQMDPGFGAIVGMGGSCFVSLVDDATVHKSYEIWVNGRRRSYYPEPCEDDLAREAAVYAHLGRHDNILVCHGLDEIHRDPAVHALRLELAPLGTVRTLIQKTLDDPLPAATRLQMCRDTAAAVAHIHRKGVWHSDLSCRNLMLFAGHRVKLGDFGGAIIEAATHQFPATAAEEEQYALPCRGREADDLPRLKRELFALGSCLYEIMAWQRPFQGLEDHEVRRRYEAGDFPPLASLPAAVGDVVDRCWHEALGSAEEAVHRLRE
ncbi:hypothetical protein SPBR_08647 [Sporothrix brasiliensis 5110]|uniref:EKC/KEOPS complex subunit BUD32 n=1 Tax=Sporothrix brasiliensis 5110 TaxID=1398154 RepID=A0A0C2EK20_9PEZI|nr:uncharacterized protein SPBR_08647 [Sporothrix brasiliensis 5110]KIH86439.1 hypothetical protein SPBR_08647 [Sporothrix brasiliensis 5110]